MSFLEKLHRRVLPLLALCLLGLLGAWLVLAPAEARLGSVVKVVYLHGALVWAGLVTFSLAGGLALVALLTRRLVWYRGTRAGGQGALLVWLIYVLSAMLVTGLTWGQLIAWGEPRVRATALILVAAVLLALVGWAVNHRDFSAVVNLVMGVLPWIVVRRAGAIRHPEDPIGGSQSASIQLFYMLIVLTVAGLVVILIAWLWIRLELRTQPQVRAEGHAGMDHSQP
jgi:hypothetical protein